MQTLIQNQRTNFSLAVIGDIQVSLAGPNLKSEDEFFTAFFYPVADESAKEALTDMPPRSEEELDAVTLHNQALMNMDVKPTEGFEKIQFLLQQNPFPAETLGNLLILYCRYEYYDLAADVLAENSSLSAKYLSPVKPKIFSTPTNLQKNLALCPKIFLSIVFVQFFRRSNNPTVGPS